MASSIPNYVVELEFKRPVAYKTFVTIRGYFRAQNSFEAILKFIYLCVNSKNAIKLMKLRTIHKILILSPMFTNYKNKKLNQLYIEEH